MAGRSEFNSRILLKNMLSQKLINLYKYITNETGKMVGENIDKEDLTGDIDYASVYAASQEEFDEYTKDLKANGHPFDNQPTGSYYWLDQPLQASIGQIKRCRIRIPDKEHLERGYNDFQVKNYEEFKKKYLDRPNFSIIGNFAGDEMVELRDPKFNVRAYFLAKL